ncbi:EthD domain-containing protein [Kumtagia ephedrae]|uniref:EthD domain-containing protein n=1 Tax=Kumtagia ephedrae TaxID=2116701 RepID=A0A2P7SRZ6_9HYPH|nr:EthD domain-containing protein [Mesorhizobium ephedrae]PSJ65252.1 hypothetical protein C7I84_02590 [Mesorhizobium ephedrae]
MATFRHFTFLKRKPGLTVEDFTAAWSNGHASRLLSSDTFWSSVASYRQNRVLPAIPEVTPEPLWDGLVQIELKGAADTDHDGPLGKTIGAEDFVDPGQMVQFVAEAKVVLDGPARGVKILSLPRRRAGLSPAEFSRHYREVHGALVARNEAFKKYTNRYVQHHVHPRTVKATDGFVPYDGISEFWFDSLDHARAAWAAPSYMAELRADEKNFVGSPPSHRLLVEEVVFPRL